MLFLFVCHVCMPRECDGDDNAGVGAEGYLVALSAGSE